MRSVTPFSLLILLLPALAWGQPQLPNLSGPGSAGPMDLPVPAEPDTVSARLVLPEDFPQPVAVTFAPDTVTVGSPAELRLIYGPGQGPADPATLLESAEFSTDWIGRDLQRATRVIAGDTLVVPVRIYQIDPFRVETGELVTPVVLVDLRTSGLQETAAIRGPRRWGWNLLTLAVAALLITALVLLAWWGWTARRVATEQLDHWPVPPPAWLPAALELEVLHDERLADRGEARLHLDRLAGICRRYLAGRYRVGAVEMTAPEIASSCRLLGHTPGPVGRFTRLLDLIDSSRYNPEALSPAACRQRSREFLLAVAEARIMPRFTPVAPELDLAGRKAWTRLERELAEEGV